MIEIERKFRVKNHWPKQATAQHLAQGYLATDIPTSVRIRRQGSLYYLSVKTSIDTLSRYEFEYPVPEEDGALMLSQLCRGGIVEKRRHVIAHGALQFEIDEFLGANAGLVVAEIELPSAECEFDKPDWLGEEVSDDPRYLNTSLSIKPYSDW